MKKSIAWILILGLAFLLSCSAAGAEPAASGACGTGLTWEVSSDGKTLTFGVSDGGSSASYTMADYSSPEEVPWKDYRSTVTAIRFEGGWKSKLQNIGDYAFFGFSSLESIKGNLNSEYSNLPGGISVIGKKAFSGCAKYK